MAKANGHLQQFETYNLPADKLPDVPTTSKSTATDVCGVSAGFVLADNRILDLIRRPGSESELIWLVWDKGEYSLVTQVESGGRIYVPPAVEGGVVRAVQMPVALGPCLEPRELLRRMEAVIHTFIDINNDDGFLMAAFALATFFADRLTLAPYLFLNGPPGSGKTTALQLLCRMTRRGLLAGDMSRAALYNLVHLIAPTLLLDESDLTSDRMSRDIMRLLRNGNRLGADIHVNGRRFNVFGPKVICGRTPVEDIALASRGFRITMLPSRNIYPFLDAEQQQQIGNEFQPLLERFRLEHYHEVKMAVADGRLQLTP